MDEVLKAALEVASKEHEKYAHEEDALAAQITELAERRRVANAYRAHWSNLMAALRVAVGDVQVKGGAS